MCLDISRGVEITLWLKSLKSRPPLTSESEGHLPSPAHRPSGPSLGFLGRLRRLWLGATREGWAPGGQFRERGNPGSEAQRGGGSSLSPWSVPPLSVPRPCLSVSPVSLSLGLWEAGPWLSAAPCFPREENQQNFAVARTYSCESPNRRVQGLGSGLGVSIWGLWPGPIW